MLFWMMLRRERRWRWMGERVRRRGECERGKEGGREGGRKKGEKE